MKTLLIKADVYLSSIFRFLLVSLTLILTTMMTSAVFFRYVINHSLPAVEELSILLGLWLYFIAMIVVTRDQAHLTGGILELFNLSHQSRMRVKWFNDFIGLVVICFFGFYAFKYLFFVIKINRLSTNLGWPTAMWISAAVAGFTFMSFYKLRDLMVHNNSATSYDETPHTSEESRLENVSS